MTVGKYVLLNSQVVLYTYVHWKYVNIKRI